MQAGNSHRGCWQLAAETLLHGPLSRRCRHGSCVLCWELLPQLLLPAVAQTSGQVLLPTVTSTLLTVAAA